MTVEMGVTRFFPSVKIWEETEEDYLRLQRGWVILSAPDCVELAEQLNRSLRVATKVFLQQKEMEGVCGRPS